VLLPATELRPLTIHPVGFSRSLCFRQLSVLSAVKDVPFDPIAMFDRDVSSAPGGTSNGACCDWPTDFCNRTIPPVTACLQIMPVFRHSYGRTSSRTHSSTRRKTCCSPTCLMNAVPMVAQSVKNIRRRCCC
jgi:hypothetical protein